MDAKLERNLENKLARQNRRVVNRRIKDLEKQYDELIAEGFDARALSVKIEIMELVFNFSTYDDEYDI